MWNFVMKFKRRPGQFECIEFRMSELRPRIYIGHQRPYTSLSPGFKSTATRLTRHIRSGSFILQPFGWAFTFTLCLLHCRTALKYGRLVKYTSKHRDRGATVRLHRPGTVRMQHSLAFRTRNPTATQIERERVTLGLHLSLCTAGHPIQDAVCHNSRYNTNTTQWDMVGAATLEVRTYNTTKSHRKGTMRVPFDSNAFCIRRRTESGGSSSEVKVDNLSWHCCK